MTNKLTMKAAFDGEHTSNAINYFGTKEKMCSYSVVGKMGGVLRVVAEARFYMGRSSSASVVYCSLWVHGEHYCSGSGKAGGYGYHKESAALAEAIRSAGISLTGSNYATWGDAKPSYKNPARISGCGSESVRMALLAIAKAAGAKGEMLIV